MPKDKNKNQQPEEKYEEIAPEETGVLSEDQNNEEVIGTQIMGFAPIPNENEENTKTTSNNQQAEVPLDLPPKNNDKKNPLPEAESTEPPQPETIKPLEGVDSSPSAEDNTEHVSEKIKLEFDTSPDERSEKQETEETIRNIFEESMQQKLASRMDMNGESIVKNDTRLSRILQILTSVIVGTMLIMVTIFFEQGEQVSEWGALPNYIVSEGETEIALLSDQSFLVSLQQALFGGETIHIKTGLAEVRLFDGTSIRMQEGAEITLKQLEPYPIIRHQKGDIWVLSQRFVVMEYDNARFYSRNSSAEFLRSGERIEVSAYRHPLFGEVWHSEAATKTLMIIPPKKKITFAQNALPPTLSGLHFSKLKKELQLQSAQDNDWVRENITSDRRVQNQKYEKISNTKKVNFKSDGILANISDIITLFPSRKKRNQREEIQNRERAYYDEFVFGESSYGLNTREATDSVLDTALYYSTLAQPDVRILKNARQLINEAQERKEFPHKKIVIAQTLLTLLEDSLYMRDSELASKVMSEIVGLWSKEQESEENKRMLELYRETIANLMRKNMDQVGGVFFSSATRLDELALEWEQQEQIVIALEIVERNIDTAESFLKKMQFEKAEDVIEINETLLQIQPTAKLITAYRDIKQKQTLLEAKHQIFSERKAVLSDSEFHAILSEKEAAKKTIETIKQTQDIFANLNQSNSQNSILQQEKPLAEIIRDDFTDNGLIAVSILGADEEDTGIIEIIEGRLEDGTIFSAEYIPHLMVIKDMKIPSEEMIIPGDILLAEVNIAVQTIRSERMGSNSTTLEDEVDEQEEDWKETGDDPLKGVDPLIIEVSRRLLLAELQKNGFSVSLPDIQMVSKEIIEVEYAQPDSIGGDESISFDFNTQTKFLSNVRLQSSGVQVNAQTISELEEKMIETITHYAEEQENIENLLYAFGSAGANTEFANINLEGDTIEFYGIEYEEWTLSGTANINNEAITMLQRDGLPLASNTLYNELENILEDKWKIYFDG